jgi:ubiquitin-protein ligase
MILPDYFPMYPPEVRFVSPIYHLNVDRDGRFCDPILQRDGQWTPAKTLVDAVKIIVQQIDNPDIDYSASMELGRLYTKDRKRFDEIALEYVLKYGCPRI